MAKRDTYFFKNRYRDAYSTNFGSPTSSLSEVKLGSVAVTANTFVAGDILTIETSANKFGTNGTWNLKLYWNDTDDLVTPITIGTVTLLSTPTLQYLMMRRVSIAVAAGSGNGSIVWPPAVSSINDLTGSVTAPASIAINWTTAGYIILAGDVDNAADQIQARWIKVSN
jgi:hypothetical protein